METRKYVHLPETVKAKYGIAFVDRHGQEHIKSNFRFNDKSAAKAKVRKLNQSEFVRAMNNGVHYVLINL